MKEWNLIYIIRAFNLNFQIATMVANTTTTLFNNTSIEEDKELNV